MKNKRILAYILLIVPLLFSSLKTDDRPLQPQIVDWDTHYLAKPDEKSAAAALTTTTWHYEYRASVDDGHLHIDFNFVAGIDPDRSWVKHHRIKNRWVSQHLLNHEQGHVYINYIQLRDGEIKMQNQRYTPANYKQLIKTTANNISRYYSSLQSRYDLETKHGSDLEAQANWDERLQNLMHKFD